MKKVMILFLLFAAGCSVERFEMKQSELMTTGAVRSKVSLENPLSKKDSLHRVYLRQKDKEYFILQAIQCEGESFRMTLPKAVANNLGISEDIYDKSTSYVESVNRLIRPIEQCK